MENTQETVLTLKMYETSLLYAKMFIVEKKIRDT